jgi:hypothetical protein
MLPRVDCLVRRFNAALDVTNEPNRSVELQLKGESCGLRGGGDETCVVCDDETETQWQWMRNEGWDEGVIERYGTAHLMAEGCDCCFSLLPCSSRRAKKQRRNKLATQYDWPLQKLRERDPRLYAIYNNYPEVEPLLEVLLEDTFSSVDLLRDLQLNYGSLALYLQKFEDLGERAEIARATSALEAAINTLPSILESAGLMHLLPILEAHQLDFLELEAMSDIVAGTRPWALTARRGGSASSLAVRDISTEEATELAVAIRDVPFTERDVSTLQSAISAHTGLSLSYLVAFDLYRFWGCDLYRALEVLYDSDGFSITVAISVQVSARSKSQLQSIHKASAISGG